MNNIPYAITYIEWSDDIAALTKEQAGRLLKALLSATFEEDDALTNSLKEDKKKALDALLAGEITAEEWANKTREVSVIECRWDQMKSTVTKNRETYKKRSAANAENGKKKAGKTHKPKTTKPEVQAQPKTETAPVKTQTTPAKNPFNL